MKELFPLKQVMGFIFSLVLTGVALLVLLDGISFAVGMTILLITAFVQAFLQLMVFMHARESEDKDLILSNVYYGVFIAVVTVFGSLLALIWGYM